MDDFKETPSEQIFRIKNLENWANSREQDKKDLAKFLGDGRKRRQEAARRLPPLGKGYRDPHFRSFGGNNHVPS